MFNLSYGDVLVILGGAAAVGYGAVRYGVSQSLKAIEAVRQADKKAADDKANALAATVKEQHKVIADNVHELSDKVDALTVEVKEKFGELRGLEIDKRLTQHDERIGALERSNPYVNRRKHPR